MDGYDAMATTKEICRCYYGTDDFTRITELQREAAECDAPRLHEARELCKEAGLPVSYF